MIDGRCFSFLGLVPTAPAMAALPAVAQGESEAADVDASPAGMAQIIHGLKCGSTLGLAGLGEGRVSRGACKVPARCLFDRSSCVIDYGWRAGVTGSEEDERWEKERKRLWER